MLPSSSIPSRSSMRTTCLSGCRLGALRNRSSFDTCHMSADRRGFVAAFCERCGLITGSKIRRYPSAVRLWTPISTICPQSYDFAPRLEIIVAYRNHPDIIEVTRLEAGDGDGCFCSRRLSHYKYSVHAPRFVRVPLLTVHSIDLD